jgi:alkanesulfonate monooxygenase
MPIEFIGMIGVRPEGADGAAVHVIGGHDLGVTTLLIRGFDPLHDAEAYGRELIPLVRREVARRDRAAA